MKLVGRIHEKKMLERVFSSHESEFIVIYGRRRIGKTFLITQFFKEKSCVFFHATGLKEGKRAEQLKKFSAVLSETFFNHTKIQTPENWGDAFEILHKQIQQSSEKIIIFLDELPWMATNKSGLLNEIDYYWNRYWSGMDNVILVVCGSSASWMIEKIIYNKGGLHNRVTCEIQLMPFLLSETKAFLEGRDINLNHRHILKLYMALGGIPYYLRYISPGLTADENIQAILFDKQAPLRDEFTKLFDSLFNDSLPYVELVQAISSKKEGVARSELAAKTQIASSGGRLTKRLKHLCDAGFLAEHHSLNKNIGEYYRVIDEFCLFYLSWMDNKNIKLTSDHWLQLAQSPSYSTWMGYAFEAVCAKHIDEILHTLNIRAGGKISSWRYTPRTEGKMGAQIDMILDRPDDAINLFEMKCTEEPFYINKNYYEQLQKKKMIFIEQTKTKKQIFFSLISASGLRVSKYNNKIIDGVVTLDDLFET